MDTVTVEEVVELCFILSGIVSAWIQIFIAVGVDMIWLSTDGSCLVVDCFQPPRPSIGIVWILRNTERNASGMKWCA